MNKLSVLRFTFLLCSIPVLGSAQEPEFPSPPVPPLVGTLPSVMSWTITNTDERKPLFQPEKGPDGKPVSIPLEPFSKEQKIQKVNNLFHSLTLWPDGRTAEVWVVDSYSLTVLSGRSSIYIRNLKRGTAFNMTPKAEDPANSSDFRELNWLSLKNYVDLVSYQGKKCYHFSMELEPAVTTDKVKKKAKIMQAWLDAKTKLPVAIDNEDLLKTYVFTGPYFTKPVLPERLVKALHDYQAIDDPSKYRLKVN